MTDRMEEACPVCHSSAAEEVNSRIRDWEYGVAGIWSHLRCLQCGVVRIHPFPSIADLKRAYDIDYHGYVGSTQKGLIYKLLYKLNDRMLVRQLSRHVRSGACVLDVGCGSGEFLTKFRLLGAAQLDGIDFHPQAIQQAAERGIRTFQGIFADFPADSSSYDVVVMNNYLEHTINPAEELEKVIRILRPGGSLIGEIPNYQALDRVIFGRYWGGNHAPRHTYHFSPASLRHLLERAGFSDIRISQQINPAHAALSVQNFLQRNRDDLMNNPVIRHGRAWYYGLLLLLTAPVNAIAAAFGCSGLMRFEARRPS